MSNQNNTNKWRIRGFFIASLCMALAETSFIFSLPLLAIHYSASIFQIGLLGALRLLPYVLFTYFSGRLSDKVGRDKMALISSTVLFILYIMVFFSNSLTKLFVIVPLFGLFLSLYWPPVIAWVGELPGKRCILKSTRLFNISWSTGTIIGPLLAGILFQIYFRLPIVFSCLMVAVVLVLISLVPIRKEKEQESFSEGNIPVEVNPLHEVYQYVSWIGLFAAFFTTGASVNLFPKLAVELGFSPRTLGYLIMLMSLSRTAMFFLLGQGHNWQYRIFPLIFMQVLAAAGLLLIKYFSSPVLFAFGFLSIGVGAGMTYTSSIVYCLQSGKNTGAKGGIHEAILAAGFIIGSFICGIMAQKFGLRVPYLLCSMLIITAVVLELVFLGFRKNIDKT